MKLRLPQVGEVWKDNNYLFKINGITKNRISLSIDNFTLSSYLKKNFYSYFTCWNPLIPTEK